MKSYNLYKHFFLNIFLKYVRDNIVYRFTEQQHLQTCVTYSENCIQIVSMLNCFRFLNVGKRPSLVDFILGLDNISMFGNRRREIGYSHMTRELIWSGFMVIIRDKHFQFNCIFANSSTFFLQELLGFTLPLINYHYVKRKYRNILKSMMPASLSSKQAPEKPKFDINTTCAYCDKRPTLPYHMGCRHVFCYYCLKGNLLADAQFECPSCGNKSDIVRAI